MHKPSKPAPSYISPVVRAGQILARAAAGERVSKPALSTAQRIDAFPFWLRHQLEREKMPYRVARWIAWGKSSELVTRADLASLLRGARPSRGWPDAHHLKVAFDVYRQAPSTRFGAPVSGVPIEQYLAAIDTLPKRHRVASRRSAEDGAEERAPVPVIVGEDDVLRALTASQRPRRGRPPAIKLRTTPLHIGGKAAGSPPVDIEHMQAENAWLRARREDDEQEAERQRDLLRRENARLKAKVELLEQERAARSQQTPSWLVGLGGAVVGAVGAKIALSGTEVASARERKNAAPGALDGEALFKSLLPVFDNLSRAQQHAEEAAPAAAIAEGLRMVRIQLDEALARSGVERVPTVGHAFDPGKHAAVDHVEAPEPAGVVLREVLPGYTAGGRLLRAASVVVSRGRTG